MPEAEQQATQFLDALFAEKPPQAAIQVWIRAKKSVTWCVDDTAQAARLAIQSAGLSDVYVGCGLAPRPVERPLHTRLKAHEVVGIPGVWADIDINGGPESKAGAAPTREAALELAGSLLEPSVLISSGYGIQAWWLWEDGPWMFSTNADNEQARRVVAGYQGALRASARRLGWGLDATQDLARVMRIPGTYNHKGSEPAPVELLEMSGKLYHIEEVGELGQEFSAAREVADESDVVVEVRQGANVDGRVMTLIEDEPEFRSLWNRRTGAKGGARAHWTASEFEMAICNWLVRAGLSDQELCDALVYWRLKIEPGDPRNKCRRERIARTIARVRATAQIEVEHEQLAVEQERAVKELELVARGVEEPNEAKALSQLNRVIRGPEIARLRQHSRDPEMARFAIELADGREVSIGQFSRLCDWRAFRERYAIVTGHMPTKVKQTDWEKVVAGLMKVAHVVDDQEDSREAELAALLDEYMDACGSPDRDGACAAQAPFDHRGKRHVHIAHMLRWLRRARGERIERGELIHRLRMMGFERTTVAYDRPDYVLEDGEPVRSSRSYFATAELAA